jgi:hypothetical protein
MGQKFFISFNSADRDKAHWIAWTLREAGHEVAVYDWEIPVGGNIPLWMSTRLAWADRSIAVISPDYVRSQYSPMEWASRIWNDPDGTKGSVIPVIVRPTSKIPPLLKDLNWIDLTNCSEDEARRRLIKGVDMPAPPELKPEFEKIEVEAPDYQHVGPAEKPLFDARAFYRRLEQNLTQLDFSVSALAPERVSFGSVLLLSWFFRTGINRVKTDAKAVCEARRKVAELGDTAILEQLNALCKLFQMGEDFTNLTGSGSVISVAKLVGDKGLVKKLLNDVSLKAR